MVILSLSMIYIYICKIAHQMCYNHPFSQRNKVFVEKKENENVDIEHEIENLVMETDEILHETTWTIPSLKIGFSTFALLWPKWCMPVGILSYIVLDCTMCVYAPSIKMKNLWLTLSTHPLIIKMY